MKSLLRVIGDSRGMKCVKSIKIQEFFFFSKAITYYDKWVAWSKTKWAIFTFLPQSLLTHVSRATKQTLNKLGVFTVSSFHAFICARSPSLLNNLLAGRGATKRRPPLLSRSNSGSSRRSLQISSRDEEKSVKVSVPENQVRSSGHRVSS